MNRQQSLAAPLLRARRGTGAGGGPVSRLMRGTALIAASILAGGIAIAVWSPPALAAPPDVVLYAAPGGTGPACVQPRPCSLPAAKQMVRHILSTGEADVKDVVVQLAGGTYYLAAPLQFGPQDSGRDGHTVTWTAAPGAHPVISGGTRATGWTDSDPAQGIWSTKVPAGTTTRQVYVDGKEAQMAQASTSTLGLSLGNWNSTGFVTSGATATYFSNLAAEIGPDNVKNLEMMWTPMPPTDWEESECPVASIGSGTITMAQPCWNNLTSRPATIWGAGNNNVNPYELRAGSAPTAIVNAYPLLTQPGQWYLDTGTDTLYYKPTAGQNMALVDVQIPRLQSLLQVTGTLTHPVHDLTFSGLTFTTSTWMEPSTDLGFVQIQDNLHITGSNNQGECTFTTPAGSCPWGGFGAPPGAVQLTAARHVSLTGDTFADLGSVGVEIKYGSDDNQIQGGTFTQIASSAIWLGCSGDPDPTDSAADPVASIVSLCAADPASATEDTGLAGGQDEIMTGNTVDNNVVYHVGYDYLGAAGITLMFSQHTTISHNDVFDVPYDGLTSGAWQGHPDNISTAPTHSTDVTTNINSDNAISDNYFHNDMEVFTGDGGNIYTEGDQGITVHNPDGTIDTAASYTSGLQISGNLFNADPPGNGAYSIAPDVGSQWIEATGNVEWGLAYSFSCHWPTNAGSELEYTGNWRANPDDSTCPTDFNNTQIPSNPGPADIPLDVLARAGVQGQYQALEAALPATVDYSGVSPASGSTPEEVLVTGSGFTRSTAVYVGGVISPHVQFVSSGVLVAAVPSGVTDTSEVTVPQQLTLTPSSSVLQPGQQTDLTVTIANPYSFPLTDATLTLGAARGWQVDPPAFPLRTIQPGTTIVEHATLTAPSTRPASSSNVTATLRYTANGTAASTDTTATVQVPYPNLAASFDNIGISNDTNTNVADIDANQSSFSAQALASVGVTAGGNLTHEGVTFTWPGAAPGQPDNTVASGQAITVNGSGGTLAFLVTSVDGASSGTGTVIYTDGSQQTFTLAVPDWYGRPAPGSDPAITAPYRNRPDNTQDHTPVNVYYCAVALDPGKTVAVAVLPRVSDGVSAYIPSLHVFAIGIG